ncbi:MAG: TRAP transporter large permease subunit, partial [Limnobacter sp.]|nr:TRAP transporter large permease subunit [Limnobacter sp.]
MSKVSSEWENLRNTPFLYGWAVLVAAVHLYMNMSITISGYWPNVIHFCGFALLCAGWGGTSGETRVKTILYYAVAIMAITSTLWIIGQEDAIYDRGMRLSTIDWVAGLSLIAGALILTWRVAGWLIPTLIVIALGYVAWWGQFLPGVFRFAGLSPETILFRTVFGDDALFGSIASISSSFVMMFIIFGAFLVRSGAGEFIIELAKRAAGKMQGGPGLIAVMSSGLTGTISGSAVANTASTGVITIPMMIKAGYKPKFAAGVEAAASTGGQLMPPIMGAGAFVMA